ncbi:Beta-glucanase/Beta-glucan synthetase [Nocardioides sp. J9]|uniref:glycoside hydrolase family 16 protein n=1 Tax=unclassified Nocardioides TaxID=2615069 RepID=UPI0011A98667|nr:MULTISPECIES: glycoside hydrolase family 16 protein [unclassified Nocardioides]TWG99438.1 Beta-glucanase/Beta-glucan synthetase [Nocardioides sp. J9]
MRPSRPVLLLLVGLVTVLAAAAAWWVQRPDEPLGPDGPCGPPVRKDGGGTWECTFAEDFDGDRLDPDTWTATQLVGSDDLCMVDHPSTVSVADGRLRLSVVAADDTTPCPVRADGTRASYAGGWVTTDGRWSQQYGRFEARIRVQDADGPGLHEAFWLWPDTRYGADRPWPQSGEIDVMETYSHRPDLVIPFLHYAAGEKPVNGVNTAWDCRTTRGEWHTYTLEWTADRLEVLVDGDSCLVNTEGAPALRKRFIIALTQSMGTGENAYDGSVPLPVTMEVDWVRAWR